MKPAGYDRVTRHVWTQIPAEPPKGMITRKLISGDRMKIAHRWLRKCDDLSRHQHENEQLTDILRGTLRLWFAANDEREITIRASEVVDSPSNVPHRALAL